MATLHGKTALVAGAGALGAPAALALAAGGVARLVLDDAAVVGPADLAHPLLRPGDAGAPRAVAVARHLGGLFPSLEVEAAVAGEAGLAARVAAADVVIDATNRFARMFALNDAAAAARKPLVHGGALQLAVQLLTVLPGATGCLRCLFEAPPPASATPGADPVLGPVAGFAGALLGAEALRLLEGAPAAYAGRLLVHDARSARTRAVPVRPRPGCPACGARAVEAA